PRDLFAVRFAVHNGRYHSVGTFCSHVAAILDSVVDDNDREEVGKAFCKEAGSVFSWFNFETGKVRDSNDFPETKIYLLPNATMPPTPEHDYAQWQDKDIVTHPGTPDPSPMKSQCSTTPSKSDTWASPLKNNEDLRQCIFCSKYGDDHPMYAGRLLYCSQDEWCHVNCALWSAEVYEQHDGSLQNVQSAASRGKMMKCELCKLPGATVGCSTRQCPKNYHFMCARKTDCAFQNDKKVFCLRHHSNANIELIYDEEFEVLRMVCVDNDEMRPNRRWQRGVLSSNITVTIGSLTVHQLGRLGVASDIRDCLIPASFRMTRVFWSAFSPTRKTVYTITVSEKKPSFDGNQSKPAADNTNLTISHANEHPAPSSPPSSKSKLHSPPHPCVTNLLDRMDSIPPIGPLSPTRRSSHRNERRPTGSYTIISSFNKTLPQMLTPLPTTPKYTTPEPNTPTPIKPTKISPDNPFLRPILSDATPKTLPLTLIPQNGEKEQICSESVVSYPNMTLNSGTSGLIISTTSSQNQLKPNLTESCEKTITTSNSDNEKITPLVSETQNKMDTGTSSVSVQPTTTVHETIPCNSVVNIAINASEENLSPKSLPITVSSEEKITEVQEELKDVGTSGESGDAKIENVPKVPVITSKEESLDESLKNVTSVSNTPNAVPPKEVSHLEANVSDETLTITEESYQKPTTPKLIVRCQKLKMSEKNEICENDSDHAEDREESPKLPAKSMRKFARKSVDEVNQIKPVISSSPQRHMLTRQRIILNPQNVTLTAVLPIRKPQVQKKMRKVYRTTLSMTTLLSQAHEEKPDVKVTHTDAVDDGKSKHDPHEPMSPKTEKMPKENADVKVTHTEAVDGKSKHDLYEPLSPKSEENPEEKETQILTVDSPIVTEEKTDEKRDNDISSYEKCITKSPDQLTSHIDEAKEMKMHLSAVDDQITSDDLKVSENNISTAFFVDVSIFVKDIFSSRATTVDFLLLAPYNIFIGQNHSSNKGNRTTPPHTTNKPYMVYEITSEDGYSAQGTDLQDLVSQLLSAVQECRATTKGPSPTVALHAVMTPFSFLGVSHDAVRFLAEQLPGARYCHRYRAKYHKHKKTTEEVTHINPHGCARAEQYKGRSKPDMFSFLASKHRYPPVYDPDRQEDDLQQQFTFIHSVRRATSCDLPMAMRFRQLRHLTRDSVGVYRSTIHGRGLYCKRDFDSGEMIMEYTGQIIRQELTDKREKYYESKSIGCYMFRMDDFYVVDATVLGSGARFINHSCDPNCYSRIVQFEGKKHIVIFALREIYKGEELTYDYKFPIEDENHKIACTCGARLCRKFMN
uniref:[histone H3]-lysine(4) N-methyltransferase n=1 Tax=Ciona intestinalis TaxID=7719 RepID=F6PQ66_CIOIN